MKNTLAENLLRFGVKNLSESEKKSLNEQATTQEAYTVIPMTISVPYKKDATGKMVLDTSKWVKIFAANEKGTEGTSLENYDYIASIDFGGNFVKVVGPKKDASGNITGNISIYGAEGKALASYLSKQVGKTLGPGDKSVTVTLRTKPSGFKSLYASNSVFKMYDTGAAAAPTTTV